MSAGTEIQPGQNAGGPAPSGDGPDLNTPSAVDTPDLCGQPHEYKTPKGGTNTKPCIKARGHEGPHSSRAPSVKVDMSGLSLDMLVAEEVPGDETLDILSERVRTAEQLRVDKDVLDGHAKWIKAGKPAGANEAIKLGAASRYKVAPQNVAAIRALLRRAENAPEVKDAKIHVRILPAKKNVDGNMMVYFISVDKSEARAAAHAAPATPPAADTPPPAVDTPLTASPGTPGIPPVPPVPGGKRR